MCDVTNERCSKDEKFGGKSNTDADKHRPGPSEAPNFPRQGPKINAANDCQSDDGNHGVASWSVGHPSQSQTEPGRCVNDQQHERETHKLQNSTDHLFHPFLSGKNRRVCVSRSTLGLHQNESIKIACWDWEPSPPEETGS